VFDPRHERLVRDRQGLTDLTASSTILTWQADGESLDGYTLTFAGKGLVRESEAAAPYIAEWHVCTLRLPFSYPQAAPDIQWRTALFHPNISFGGLMTLDDVGLPWHEQIGLDVVCERLWDAVRLAYVHPQRIINQAAHHHLRHADWNLPLDERPLRDCAARQVRNIVRYRRKQTVNLSSDAAGPSGSGGTQDSNGILYIGDET
jgi:ubiquitin-protein ligase